MTKSRWASASMANRAGAACLSCPPPSRSPTWPRPSWPICHSAPATASLPCSTAWAGRPSSSCIRLRRTGTVPARPADRHRPPPRRQLHHQPRHGRLLDHPLAGRRRVAVAVGRPGADAGPAMGDVNMAVSREDVLRWLDASQKVFAENRQQLTELDSAVGDGDFGISLDRGFTAVQAELSANPPADLRSVFQNAATVLIRTMGGTSGPLLGTFFSARERPVRASPSSRPPTWWRCSRPASTASNSGAKPRSATRPCWTLCFPQWMRCGVHWRLETVWRKSWNGAQRRPKRACRRPDHAGPQGPWQLSGRPQRRTPGPRRDRRSSLAESCCGSVAGVIVTLCYISHRCRGSL